MKRNVLVLLTVAVLAGFAFYANSGGERLPTEVAPREGYLAPAFSLDGLDGQQYAFEPGESGKAMMVNFWYSTCDPCKEEAPDLRALYDKYEDDLDIYAVNALTLDSLEGVEGFVEEYRLEFPILLDRNSQVVDLYKAYGFPTNFLIDRDGVVQEVLLGLHSPDEVEHKIRDLIR